MVDGKGAVTAEMARGGAGSLHARDPGTQAHARGEGVPRTVQEGEVKRAPAQDASVSWLALAVVRTAAEVKADTPAAAGSSGSHAGTHAQALRCVPRYSSQPAAPSTTPSPRAQALAVPPPHPLPTLILAGRKRARGHESKKRSQTAGTQDTDSRHQARARHAPAADLAPGGQHIAVAAPRKPPHPSRPPPPTPLSRSRARSLSVPSLPLRLSRRVLTKKDVGEGRLATASGAATAHKQPTHIGPTYMTVGRKSIKLTLLSVYTDLWLETIFPTKLNCPHNST
ncbi:hypothetical protein DFH27DRAFT_608278 [Peziza echinospora]|nr:hypothetical protein DFH27DRAFT_608278 [Peziza echinospora]